MVFIGHATPQPRLTGPVVAGDVLALHYPGHDAVSVLVLAGADNPWMPGLTALCAVTSEPTPRLLAAPRWYAEVDRGPLTRAAEATTVPVVTHDSASETTTVALPDAEGVVGPQAIDDAERMLDTLELEVAFRLGLDLTPYVLDVLEDEEEAPDELHDLFFDVVPWEAFESVLQRLLAAGRIGLDDGVVVLR